MSREPGRFTIDIAQTVGSINRRELILTYLIPKQTMRLRGIRVQIDTAANALASGVLYFDLQNSSGESILSYNHLIDDNPNTLLFSIPLENAVVTNFEGLDKPLFMAADLDKISYLTVSKFTAASGFSLETNILRFYLDFELEDRAFA